MKIVVSLIVYIILHPLLTGSAIANTEQRPGYRMDQAWDLNQFNKANQSVIRKGKLTHWSLANGIFTMVSQSDSVVLAWPFDLDPNQYPILSFSLKVDSLPLNADERERSKDDSAFQLYLLFDREVGLFSPGHSLGYVWTNIIPKGSSITSRYFESLKIISIEQGTERLGQWLKFEITYKDDYLKQFKQDSVPKLIGISLQADSNDVKGSTRAQFKDLMFGNIQTP